MIAARPWLVGATVAVVLALAALVGGSSAAQGMPAGAAGMTTYTDPAGDTSGGPDVTKVSIIGDAATSTIQVTVNAPGFLPAASDQFERNVLVWLDTDNNRTTGDPRDGTEYGLVAWNDATGRWWDIERWEGTEWESAPESITMNFARTGDALTWTVNSTDLGGVTGFRFYIHACTWDSSAGEHVALDSAPDSGWWSYSLTGTTPTPSPVPDVMLLVGAPTTAPPQAVAGKRLTVTFPVAFAVSQPTSVGVVVNWVPVTSGTMVCDPSVAGKVIVHSELLKNGKARLSFVIPATAKGKLLKVKVTITATERESGKTLTASRIARFRVR